MEPESTVNTCKPTSRAPTSSSARITTNTTNAVLTAFQIFLSSIKPRIPPCAESAQYCFVSYFQLSNFCFFISSHFANIVLRLSIFSLALRFLNNTICTIKLQ